MRDDFHQDSSLSAETISKIKRERAAMERKKIKELLKLRKDIEADKTKSGRWAKDAEEEYKKRLLIQDSALITFKTIIIVGLLQFMYVVWLCGHRMTAC